MTDSDRIQKLQRTAEVEIERLKGSVSAQREDVTFGRHLGEIRVWKQVQKILQESEASGQSTLPL